MSPELLDVTVTSSGRVAGVGKIFWAELPSWVRKYLEANAVTQQTLKYVAWDSKDRVITHLKFKRVDTA